MLDDDDEEHTYDYLLQSVERHLKQTCRNKNLEGLTNTLPSRNLKVNNWTPKTKVIQGAAAKLEDQCRFHLSQHGCNWPDTCKLGRHDPEFRGKGSDGKGGKGKNGKGDKGGKGAASGGADKGDGKGGKGGKKPKGNGQEPPPPPPGKSKLPDDALVDEQGRQLCYAYVHKKCNDANCKRYHGPETKAMRKKRLEDEKRMAERAAASGGADSESKGPKAKSKARPETPATTGGDK